LATLTLHPAILTP